jgi:hypothetical protein
VGPWQSLYDPSGERADEFACLALLNAGDVAGARAGLARIADEEDAGLLELDDEGRVDAYLGPVPDPLTERDRFRRQSGPPTLPSSFRSGTATSTTLCCREGTGTSTRARSSPRRGSGTAPTTMRVLPLTGSGTPTASRTPR